MNINYNILKKNLILFIVVVSFGYIVDVMLYIYLPKTAPEYTVTNNNTIEYKRYNIKTAFKEKNTQKQTTTKVVQKPQEYKFLSNMILNGIYDLGGTQGFVIIMEKGGPQTYILAINETFKGYKLTKIYPKYVIFTKSDKEYKLSLLKSNENVKYQTVQEEAKLEQSIDIQNDKVSVKRSLVDDYIQNFDKIWKDISISEVKTKKGIDGFKVNRIKKGSVFAKLGLQKGDIIKSVNNIQLKSYNDAFRLYKKIDKIKVINMVILRDNTEQEMIYEIQ